MPLASPLARLPSLMLVRWLIAGCVVAAAACGGGVEPFVSTTESSALETPPVGFDRRVIVIGAETGVQEACVWVADTPETKSMGMMGASSMGEADAMAFISDEPTTGRFWMWNTLIDLSIAFYDRDGVYLDAFDMTVCTASDSAGCVRYDTPVGYSVAIEAPRGDLERLGLVQGSTVEVTEQRCAAALIP